MDWLGKIDSSSLMMIEIRDETAEIKNRKKIKKRNSRVGLRNPQWNTQRDRQKNMHNTFPNSYLIGWKNWFSSVANSVTYNWRNLMLFETKYMLQNSERTPPLVRGSARSLARWASERANPLARSARDSEIFGSALVSSAGSLGSMPTLGRDTGDNWLHWRHQRWHGWHGWLNELPYCGLIY